MITDIYRIKTRNSVYEIQVQSTDQHGNRFSRCRKEGIGTQAWKQVTDYSGEYLEKLCIGPSFSVPGVVDTSNVEDYNHFVLSTEPKRTFEAMKASYGIGGGMKAIVNEIIDQAYGGQVMVEPDVEREYACNVAGCTVDSPAWHDGSRMCKSGSIASGGTRAHCTCDLCF